MLISHSFGFTTKVYPTRNQTPQRSIPYHRNNSDPPRRAVTGNSHADEPRGLLRSNPRAEHIPSSPHSHSFNDHDQHPPNRHIGPVQFPVNTILSRQIAFSCQPSIPIRTAQQFPQTAMKTLNPTAHAIQTNPPSAQILTPLTPLPVIDPQNELRTTANHHLIGTRIYGPHTRTSLTFRKFPKCRGVQAPPRLRTPHIPFAFILAPMNAPTYRTSLIAATILPLPHEG